MAAKIEVDVDVKESAFDAFARKFRAYQENLDKTPDAWAKVSRSSEESLVHFEMMAAALSQQADDMARIAERVGGVRRDSESTARSWRDLAHSTQGVAKNIGDATTSLLRWSGVIGLVTGAVGLLTGYAGIQGMESIGAGVSASRAASLGLGTSYGGRSSFLTNFARLGDAGGLLARVNEIEHSADNVPLRAIGLSQAQSQGDTSDVAANAILQLKKLVDGVKDPRFLQDTLHAYRADEMISLQQAQVLRGMSSHEVQQLVGSYRRDKVGLGLGLDAQKKWQDFSTQMSRAGKEIENTFVKRLGVLTPGLTTLSDAAVHLTDHLMEKDGPVAHFLDKLAGGVEWLATEIDKPDFQKKVDDFIEGVRQLAIGAGNLLTGILSWASYLGVTPAEAATETPRGGLIGLRRQAGMMDQGGTGHGADFKAVVANAAVEAGIDPRILYGIIAGESAHGDQFDVGDNGTSFSPFQLHYGGLANEFERDTGFSARDPRNSAAIARWVAKYIARTGNLTPWHGYHGNRDWNPRWGSMGYQSDPPPAARQASTAPANASTRIVITKPNGADSHVAAAAAATP